MSSQINANYNMADAIIRQTEKIRSGNSQGGAPSANQPISGSGSFQEILNRQLHRNELSFSKHASMRTEERNIEMTSSDLTKLNDACDKASQKGIKDALVITDKAAFIVNAPNRVVITVIDKNEMKDNVFTNIDGALFI